MEISKSLIWKIWTWKSVYFLFLLSVYKIRHFLSNQAALTLVHSFVTSRIDSCNSLLFGLPSIEIHRVQMLQNIAARLVTPRSQSISQTLKKLRWLPIILKNKSSLISYCWRIRNNMDSPLHIPDRYTQTIPTSPSSPFQQPGVIVFPKLVHHYYYGSRSFAVAGPTLWNNLPQSLRQTHSLIKFKSSLKTHLFVSNS